MLRWRDTFSLPRRGTNIISIGVILGYGQVPPQIKGRCDTWSNNVQPEDSCLFDKSFRKVFLAPFLEDQSCFLYELDLRDPSTGIPLAIAWMHLRAEDITRIGILFPDDVEPYRQHHQFDMPPRHATKFHPSNELEVEVELKNRTNIESIPLDDPGNGRCLSVLREFNKTLRNWKHYGIGYYKKDKKLPEQKSHLSGRTYMFVPLIKDVQDSRLSIDWKTILRETRKESIKFLDEIDGPGSTNGQHSFDHDTIHNHMLFHRKLRYLPLGPTNGISSRKKLTAQSSFPFQSEEKKSHFIRKHGLEGKSENITFADYFLYRYGLHVRFLDQELIESVSVTSMVNCNPFLRPNIDIENESTVHLIPEFMEVLPIPLDFLFIIALEEKFMKHIERKLFISSCTYNMLQSFRTTSSTTVEWRPYVFGGFVNLLDEATTLYPCKTYERLEFLGDAVLSFFLTINAVVLNATLHLDYDDIEEMRNRYENNIVLSKAATTLKLSDIAFSGNSIGTSALSDLFESVLGCVYLMDHAMCNGLLDKAKIPFPFSTCAKHWLLTKSDWVKQGFDFRENKGWQKTIAKVRQAFGDDTMISNELEKKLGVLKGIFSTNINSSIPEILEGTCARTLLYTALFNGDPNKYLGSQRDAFIKAALLRETLSQLGSNSLKLIFSSEFFKMFPEADPNDLHLLRACAFSDDIVCYVSIKQGYHKALFDESKPEVKVLGSIIRRCDSQGQQHFTLNGGWPLPGGITEFRRRLREWSSSVHQVPQYVGIGGGRFVGFNQKLDESLTEDLVFYFKAIIGALVCIGGVDLMWYLIKSNFVELMLLDANEIRQIYKGNNTLVNSYKAAKRK